MTFKRLTTFGFSLVLVFATQVVAENEVQATSVTDVTVANNQVAETVTLNVVKTHQVDQMDGVVRVDGAVRVESLVVHSVAKLVDVVEGTVSVTDTDGNVVWFVENKSVGNQVS